MRATVLILFLLTVLPQVGSTQPPRRHELSLKRSPDSKYLVFTPQNYDPKKKYPLFIAIHPTGGPAVDQYNQWNFWTNRDHYILLCPQFYQGYQLFLSGEDKKLMAMLREVKSEFRYDPKRVYMVGFSTGAEFVQRFVFEHPGYVSAAGILSVVNYAEPPYSGKGRKTNYFVGVGKDDALSVQPTRRLREELEHKGYNVRYMDSPEGAHTLGDGLKEAFMDFLKNHD